MSYLTSEVHVDGRAAHGGVGEVLHGVPEARIVDARQTRLGPVEHQEGRQIRRIRRHDLRIGGHRFKKKKSHCQRPPVIDVELATCCCECKPILNSHTV